MKHRAGQPIRLLTLNTWKCEGNYSQRIAHLNRQWQALRPHIVACQEVFQTWDGEISTATALAGALQMNCAFVPARKKRRNFGEQEVLSFSGLEVFSVYPILETHVLALPTDAQDGERLAQYCVLEAQTEKILVINTHLSHLLGASLLRQRQLEAILATPLLQVPFDRIFLCGDFNAEEPSPEIQYLLNQTAFPAKNCRESANSPTLPAKPPFTGVGKGIDFIFCLQNQYARFPDVQQATVVLDQPSAKGIFPSDHFGVMVTFR